MQNNYFEQKDDSLSQLVRFFLQEFAGRKKQKAYFSLLPPQGPPVNKIRRMGLFSFKKPEQVVVKSLRFRTM